MSGTLLLRFGFEAAHRLPLLGGKCANIHGHSWTVEVTVAGELNRDLGIIADAGALKQRLRDWIDANLDHACLLGAEDPLVKPLADEGCRVFRFDPDSPTDGETWSVGLRWPTTEAVAHLLSRVAAMVWGDLGELTVVGVVVGEAPSISASWP